METRAVEQPLAGKLDHRCAFSNMQTNIEGGDPDKVDDTASEASQGDVDANQGTSPWQRSVVAVCGLVPVNDPGKNSVSFAS